MKSKSIMAWRNITENTDNLCAPFLNRQQTFFLCNFSWTTLPTSCQAYISFEILRERREIADLFNKYALYFRIYLIHVTIPIIQSYIQSSLSNKIFQKHV